MKCIHFDDGNGVKYHTEIDITLIKEYGFSIGIVLF